MSSSASCSRISSPSGVCPPSQLLGLPAPQRIDAAAPRSASKDLDHLLHLHAAGGAEVRPLLRQLVHAHLARVQVPTWDAAHLPARQGSSSDPCLLAAEAMQAQRGALTRHGVHYGILSAASSRQRSNQAHLGPSQQMMQCLFSSSSAFAAGGGALLRRACSSHTGVNIHASAGHEALLADPARQCKRASSHCKPTSAAGCRAVMASKASPPVAAVAGR